MNYPRLLFALGFFLMPGLLKNTEAAEVPRIPKIASDFWCICTMPDLGELEGPIEEKQHIVDHSFVLADNNRWQLWACMCGTTVSRLLYRWEGESPGRSSLEGQRHRRAGGRTLW